jgi:hypothetical protein
MPDGLSKPASFRPEIAGAAIMQTVRKLGEG